MPNDLPVINELTKKRVEWLLGRFCDTPGDRNRGGFIDPENAYADSRNSIYEAQNLFAAYLYPDFPEYYGNLDLLAKLRLHLDFMRRRQRPDGTVGLYVGGVGAGSEVGFTLPGVCETYRRLLASDLPGRDDLLAGLESYIRRGAEAVRTLFPFTSNHRWTAFTGPLAIVDSLFPDPRNGAYIEEYLSDGIDIDSDGVFFEERSPNYNIVAQWGLLYLVDYWNRPALLALVERSLRFCLAMRQPSGEAETLFSHRQDRGKVGAGWGDYYAFKRLAVETRDGVFAEAADQLLAAMRRPGRMLPSTLVPLRYYFDDPRLSEEEIPRQPLPERFEIRFHDLPLYRYREGQVAATVVGDAGGHYYDLILGNWGGKVRSDAFLSYHVGAAVIDAMKIRWGSGTGGFRPEHIKYEADGTLKLTYVDPGWDHVAHYRPPEKWGPRRIEADQNAEVTIRHDADGAFHVRVKIGGWEEMPVNVQFLLRETGTLTMPDGTMRVSPRGGHTFTDGSGVYTITGTDGSRINISGLPASEHTIAIGEGRTIPSEAEIRCRRLIAGLFTPVDFEFTLRPRPTRRRVKEDRS